MNYIKSGDVSRLNPGVVEMLKNAKRRPFEEREDAKEKNRVRAKFNLALLCIGMVALSLRSSESLLRPLWGSRLQKLCWC